jgi:hypothetical protein
MTPVIVGPGQAQVMALPPAYILPPDGQAKQDGARAAGPRGMRTHAAHVAPHRVTWRGEDLDRHHPFCALVLPHRFHFLLTCKPDSHAPLAQRLAFWQANDGRTEREGRHGHGRFTAVTRGRSSNDVRLRGGDDALPVHWFEITVGTTKTGAQLSHHRCLPNHRLRDENVREVAQASRGRWKVDNENNHGLKTKGYHLEHNFGHGKQSLSAGMLILNLLAFRFHTVLEGSEAKYAWLRKVLARRQTFFHDIQAWMRYMVCDSWGHLMDFMIRGLALESQVDTSWFSKLELLILPSKAAQGRVRRRIKTFTKRRAPIAPQDFVQQGNQVVRGWVNYDRHTNTSQAFRALQRFITVRFRRYLTCRSKGRGFGWKQYPNRALYARGLIYIGSKVIRYERAPVHARAWRLSDRRMRENCTYGGMGRGWWTGYDEASEALREGNPQQLIGPVYRRWAIPLP